MKKMDTTVVAPGFCVEEFGEDGWQAFADGNLMPSDMGPGLDEATPAVWPEGERYHGTDGAALAASHRYYMQHALPAIEHVFAMVLDERRENGGVIGVQDLVVVLERIKREAGGGR